jgi:hypothetical protein
MKTGAFKFEVQLGNYTHPLGLSRFPGFASPTRRVVKALRNLKTVQLLSDR